MKFISEVKAKELKRGSSGGEGQPPVVRDGTAALKLIVWRGNI